MGYLYLAGALVAWASMAFTYRRAEKQGANRFWTAVALGLGSLLCNLAVAGFGQVNVLAGHASQFILGGVAGLLNVIVLPFLLAAVGRGDLSITWLVVTLSFAPASIMTLLYPGGSPTLAGLAGLLMAVVAVLLLGLDVATRLKSGGTATFKKGWFFFVSLAFVFNALSTYLFTPAARLAPDKSAVPSLAFLLTLAGAIALGSLPLALCVKSPGAVRPAISNGLLAGVGSFAGCYFTLLAMQKGGIPGYIVYPAGNGGSNVLVVALSVLFLGERPGGYGWAGIASGTLALVLLGLAVA